VAGLRSRGSHPHRAEAGLNYLCLHGIPGDAAAVVIPVELMARTDVMGQRPALVVVRPTLANCVSGIHGLNPRSKDSSGSAKPTILLEINKIMNHPHLLRALSLARCALFGLVWSPDNGWTPLLGREWAARQ